MVRRMSVTELLSSIGTDDVLLAVDLREPDEFEAWSTPSYEEINKANMGRPTAPLAGLRRLELGPNRCAVSA